MAKINISIPDELLSQVDALALERHSSRSGFVAEATARYVTSVLQERAEQKRRESIDRALEKAQRIGARFGTIDGAASVREDRDRDQGPAVKP